MTGSVSLGARPGGEEVRLPSVRVVVGIATAGRPDVLVATLNHLARLDDHPDRVMLSLAASVDFSIEDAADLPFPIEVIRSELGLCAQRNALLDAAPRESVLLFIDDDFLLAEGYVTACSRLFTDHRDVVLATGHVLADGIGGPGLRHEEGAEVLARTTFRPGPGGPVPVYNAYGCNMAVRVATALRHDVRFDTDLPRYGWLEDVDFSRRIARYGRSVKYDRMIGVHLGTKRGRTPGVPLGYSQIANPVYMIRKGTMSAPRAFRMMLRNTLANIAKSLRPEPWVDRRGRLRGNLIALRDALAGTLRPNRMQDL